MRKLDVMYEGQVWHANASTVGSTAIKMTREQNIILIPSAMFNKKNLPAIGGGYARQTNSDGLIAFPWKYENLSSPPLSEKNNA